MGHGIEATRLLDSFHEKSMAYRRERDIRESNHKKKTLLKQTKFVTAIHNLAAIITLSVVGKDPPLEVQEAMPNSKTLDVNQEMGCQAPNATKGEQSM